MNSVREVLQVTDLTPEAREPCMVRTSRSNLFGHRPFLTMVHGGPMGNARRAYTTAEAAELGHAEVVSEVLAMYRARNIMDQANAEAEVGQSC